MEESDYRFFISRILAFEAENTTLKKILLEERASFDAYVAGVRRERETQRARMELFTRRIAELTERLRRLNRQKALPGILIGGGMNTGGNLEAFIGLGWKIF